MLDILFEYPIQSDRSNFSLDPTLARLGQRTQTVLRFVTPDGGVRAFDYRGNPGLVRLDPRWSQAALRFVGLGFEHILDGIDHLLFLACLVIPIRRLRPLVAIVTSFTIAHSVTLIASAFNFAPDTLWFPPLIETLIAVSILYMAVENALGVSPKRRWLITFGFGLVHGFGFSFALRETLQFAGGHMLTSLLAFNLGVEIGQLLVIVVFVAVTSLLFKYPFAGRERAGTILLSVFVGNTAWTLDARAWRPAAAVQHRRHAAAVRRTIDRPFDAVGHAAADCGDADLADVDGVSAAGAGRGQVGVAGGVVRGLRGLIGAGAIGLAIAVVVASRAEAQDLVVKNARVIVAASNPTDARVVGVISNPGMYPTYLVSATSDAAERVELRDARKKDARVPEVEIPAYGALTLEPRGLYLALINLKKPLSPGARVEVILANEAQVKTRLTAVVGN